MTIGPNKKKHPTSPPPTPPPPKPPPTIPSDILTVQREVQELIQLAGRLEQGSHRAWGPPRAAEGAGEEAAEMDKRWGGEDGDRQVDRKTETFSIVIKTMMRQVATIG